MTSYNKRHEGKGVATYFPIKQVRVDVTKHPIVIAGDKAFSKAATLVSKQEEQMLAGIATSLQVPVSMALRIAIYEACKAPDEARLMLSLADPCRGPRPTWGGIPLSLIQSQRLTVTDSNPWQRSSRFQRRLHCAS